MIEGDEDFNEGCAMNKLRSVNTHFWDDGYIVDRDPIEKLLFLYLLTNPLTSIAGVYELSVRKVAFDTGIDKEMVEKILGRFESDGKILYRDGWVVLLNFFDNQKMNPNMVKGAVAFLNAAPEWVIEELLDRSEAFRRLSKPFECFEKYKFKEKGKFKEKEKFKEKGKGKGPRESVSKESDTPDDNQPTPSKKKSSPRGSRIPDEFLLTSEMRSWAKEKRPDVDVTLETEKFVNYWRSKAGKDAVKLDWRLTWNNWILRADSPRSYPNGQHIEHRGGSFTPIKRTTNAERLAEYADLARRYPTEAELAEGNHTDRP